MTKAVFRRRGRSLVPVDREGLDVLSRLREEADVLVDIKQPRSIAHHRLLFGILNFMVDHSDRFDNVEQALIALKVATGEVDPYCDERGKTYFVPRSISFASMDQTRFAQFFDRAIYVITQRWLPPGTRQEDVRAEIEAMVAEPQHAKAS